MRENTAKTKMLGGQAAFGYALGLGSPVAAEALASCGVDFLMVDTQHGSWGLDTAILGLMGASSGSATPMVRVAANDFVLIGRLLDEGALGVVVPLVHDADDARRAADACRFPPEGERSCGWGRAIAYGDDYLERVNDQIFVAVQIESAHAVENAEAIMATPGIGGCWIGPSDLSFSMGVHPKDRADHEGVQSAIEQVLKACQNTGKIPGYAAFSPAEAKTRAEQGFQFLTAGSDRAFMMQGAKAGVKLLRGSLLNNADLAARQGIARA